MDSTSSSHNICGSSCRQQQHKAVHILYKSACNKQRVSWTLLAQLYIQLKSVVINVSGDNLGDNSFRTVTFLVFPRKTKIVWKHQQRF